MFDFFMSIAESIESFFSTTAAAVLGSIFIIVTVVLVFALLHHFENK